MLRISSLTGGRCVRFIALAALAFTLTGCGSDDQGESLLSLAKIPAQPELDFSDLAVHQSDSPFRTDLVGCITAESVDASCSLETLPLLGQQTGGADPSIEDIMDRLVVSHPWMGERFRELLGKLDPDIRKLMKGVTAVVIDDDITRSFYFTGTAAIYLDPDYLWLTQEERATISPGSGTRSRWPLLFVPLWRYTLNNDYASPDPDLFGAEGREIDDILFEAASLLYHELAHANDFLPPDQLAALDPKESVIANVSKLESSSVSSQLMGRAPLESALWAGLGKVIHRGRKPTPEEQSATAESAGFAFEVDGANDDYAYSHPAEDVAMLFEETMMKYHYQLERDIAFANLPSTMNYTCDDFIVQWGNRNRIGDPDVKERAKFVVSKILHTSSLSGFITLLEPPDPLSKTGWCNAITVDGARVSTLGEERSTDLDRRFLRDLRPPHER